jgi:hypothetical protein
MAVAAVIKRSACAMRRVGMDLNVVFMTNQVWMFGIAGRGSFLEVILRARQAHSLGC